MEWFSNIFCVHLLLWWVKHKLFYCFSTVKKVPSLLKPKLSLQAKMSRVIPATDDYVDLTLSQPDPDDENTRGASDYLDEDGKSSGEKNLSISLLLFNIRHMLCS